MTAAPIAAKRPTVSTPRRPAISPQRATLLGLIMLEIVVFAAIGTHFFSLTNLLQVLRLNTELGLIALAMTPVIVSGGIDLSVGSLVGLSAVLFGSMTRVHDVPTPIAALLTLGVGLLAGLLNGQLIARLRIPPLIVTLGTFSLFRGLAEGMTGGVTNYTDFPPSFLFVGQGALAGIPAQLPVFAIIAVFFFLLLHRSTIGRTLSAIGFSVEGAQHAGINVNRQIRSAYVLCSVVTSLAAILYVARVGQAKADAGTGYELSAITAIVLGGTNIFGGTGSIPGTLMGVLSIALLDNGLRLADLPPELAGILRGGLLLLALGFDWKGRGGRRRSAVVAPAIETDSEEFNMKNSQLAVLCVAILLAAGLVVLGNFLLIKGVTDNLHASALPAATAAGASSSPAAGKPITIAMMPKSKGNAYFIACQKGAEEAAHELNVNLLWDGPTDTDPAKQNEIVDTWVTRGVDAIAVSVENRDGLSTALRDARKHGIKIITFDADAQPDARDFFVNQATPQGIGYTLMDDAAKAMGGSGEFAIITASLTAANQNEWMKYIEARRASQYPTIKLDVVRPCDDQQNKAFEETRTVLNSYPNVKLIMAISSPAVPAAAEAVKQAGRTDVKVVGLGLPNDNKPYVHSGITAAVVLWNTMDLGYLTVRAADAAVQGQLTPGDKTLSAGRLGEMAVDGDNVMLGKPFTFDQTNIDRFDF